MDVISILEKMKVEYEEFIISETHERSEEHPKVYTKIHLTYSFKGDGIDPEKVKKAVTLSKERYCGVSAMLSKTADMSYDIEINRSKI
jgi:putative redox protein